MAVKKNIIRDAPDTDEYIWGETDRVAANEAGGFALLSTPPEIHNAHNPAILVRTCWLYVAEGYEFPFFKNPNYISIYGAVLRFRYIPWTAIWLRAETDAGTVETRIDTEKYSADLSDRCSTVYRVTHLGFSEAELTEEAVEDEEYIYLRPGQHYEDDRCICAGPDDIAYRKDEPDSCAITLYFPDFAEDDGSYRSVGLTEETFKGKALYDFSAVVKSFFSRSLSDFTEEDTALYVRYRISIPNQYPAGFNYFLAVNAVAQTGETSNRTEDIGKVLTAFPYLKWYKGYPLDYAVLESDCVRRVKVDEEGGALLHTEDGAAVATATASGVRTAIVADVRVYRPCMPHCPFYVRWINRIGGVDYFMFGKTQKMQPSVKSVNTYSPHVTDTATSRTNLSVYAITTENKVTVGADGLSREEFDALLALPFAPMTEWYNERLGKWTGLSISKFDGSHDSDHETHSVEITFCLPDINIQF